MSISAIIAANAGFQQLRDNQANSLALQTKQAQLDEANQQLDIARRTKESQINLANDQNQLSDYQAKSMLDFYKQHFSNAQKLIDATGDAQDLAEHKINQSNQQATGLLQAASQDPDGAAHINSVISAASGVPQQQQTQQPKVDLSSLGIGTMPTAKDSSTAASGGALSTAFPVTGGQLPKPDISTLFPQSQSQAQQPSQSPQGMDAQVRQQGNSPAQQDKTMSMPTAQTIAPDINEEKSQYDTSPVTAASIDEENTIQNPAITKAMNSGNPFLMQGAVQQMKDGKGFVTAPDAEKVEEEKNPFFLNKWQQHLLNDQTDSGPAINEAVQKYGLNKVLQQFPATVSQPAVMAAKYQQDPNNLSSTMGGGAQRRQMNALITAINPNWSEVKYGQIKGNIEQYLDPNTVNGRSLTALAQVGLHLNTLDQAMQNLNSTEYRNVPLFNKTAAWWQQNAAANPQLAAVNTAMTAVHNEVTNAWGGAHNSDAKKAEWDNAVSTYSSSGDWPALRSTIAKLLDEAGDAREEQFEGLANGMSLQDYRGYGAIPPGQKAILDKFANTSDSSTQGSSPRTGKGSQDYSNLWN